MAKPVGIDLGTTNSVVAATMEGGRVEVIPNAEGGRTTPSAVAFTDDGQRLVGQVARRQAILNPEATISSAKRFIGRTFDEVEQEIENVSFKVIANSDAHAEVARHVPEHSAPGDRFRPTDARSPRVRNRRSPIQRVWHRHPTPWR